MVYFNILFFVLLLGWDWGLNFEEFMLAKQVLYHLSHSSSSFCSGYFGDAVLETICWDWSRTTILLISASHVARIREVSHWLPS
jgi:hypothetical protein